MLPVDIRLAAAHAEAALPAARLFLSSAPCRSSTSSTSRSPTGTSCSSASFDKIVGASLALVAALAGLAGAVASPSSSTAAGPVFFRQRRYGFNNELIEVYKFRSMYRRHERRHGAPSWSPGATRASPASAASSARPSIDELPQLFNVVQGQTVAGRPAPARDPRQGRRTTSMTRSSTAISPATGSSPASPAGRRSTAGAARPTRRKDPPARRARSLLHRELVGAASISISCCLRRSRCSRRRTPIEPIGSRHAARSSQPGRCGCSSICLAQTRDACGCSSPRGFVVDRAGAL